MDECYKVVVTKIISLKLQRRIFRFEFRLHNTMEKITFFISFKIKYKENRKSNSSRNLLWVKVKQNTFCHKINIVRICITKKKYKIIIKNQ